MLTKDDLQQIQNIVEVTVKREVRHAVKQAVKEEFEVFDRKFTKKLNIVVDSLDGDIVNHRKRIERIETTLQLEPLH